MPEFTHDVMLYLHDVAHLLRIAADKRARQFGMTRAQWFIMLRLERQPGLSQKELSELLEVEPITVARLVDRLEQRGLVERRPDPKDRRVWRLHLLPSAAPLLEKIKAERAELITLLTTGFDAETLEVITDGLARMKATLCGALRCNRRDDAACESAEGAAEEAA